MPAPEPLAPGLLSAPFAGTAQPAMLDVLADLLPEPGRSLSGRDVVVLADGLGSELLRDHHALAPTLRRAAEATRTIRTVAPATTATAMTSLLTGAPPVRHGVLGYTVIDPEHGTALNQLTGDGPRVDPTAWMPLPTLGERSERKAVQVGPAVHAGSHLTRMAYRGWDFLGHRRGGDRVEAVRTALHRAGRDGLVLLHADDVDHAGHRHGTRSAPWREALEDLDALLAALLRRLPRGTRLHLTADHGMVDVEPSARLDPTRVPGVRERIDLMAGESRARWIRCRGGADDAAELHALLREGLGDAVLVLSREEVIAEGVLGPAGEQPAAHVRARMGDVLLLARGRTTLIDPTLPTPRHPEVGVHGSLTPREARVPLLSLEV
ncbi:alkaline phosphatase family protein [Brachybacterium hainanense]|uniref:Alkaline phosphatase family protein n=1 Tax=Brachybacterium hainanense TaxID=1541174 RepID=A0ABV6RDT8_9MICO